MTDVTTSLPDLPTRQSHDERRRLLVLAICCTGLLMSVMDITIVNVALPSLRRDLHTSTAGLQWTIDAYTLVVAGFLMLAGSMADRLGRRRVFRAGLVIFALGSLWCSLAPAIGWLIAGRALQAVGGSMLSPVAMSIVANTFPEPVERARAIGIYGSVSGLSLGLGPILGGALVDTFGWRSIFWINLPIAVLAVVGATLFVPESRAPRARRFDPVGQTLVLVALAGTVFAIIESGRYGWRSPLVLGLLAVAAFAAGGIVHYEPRRADPMLELRFFRSVPFTGATVIALAGLCAFGAFLFLNTLYLQAVRGLSALAAGACLLPVGLLIVLLGPRTGRIVGTRGPRAPLLIAGGALAAGGLAAVWLTPSAPLLAVLGGYVLFGIGMGTINPPVTNSAVAGMPRAMAGLAAAVASTCRQTGTTLGVAIAGTVVGSAVAHGGGAAFTSTARAVWWTVFGLGLLIAALAWLITTSAARRTADRAAAAFDA